MKNNQTTVRNVEGRTSAITLSKPRAFNAVVYGGLTAALGDGLFALTFYGGILGVPFLRIFQSVASGILGKAAMGGGVATFLLGVLLHCFVGMCIATVYYLVSSVWPLLLKRAVLCGLIFGMLAYLGMRYVVIPLSAVPARHGTFHLSYFLTEMIGHAFLVGLPIALITARSARRAG
jgi:hypothetical protein